MKLPFSDGYQIPSDGHQFSSGVGRRGCLITLIASSAIGLNAWFVADQLNDKPFDSEVWKSRRHADRVPMVRAARRLLPRGTPEAKVMELMGAPDDFVPFGQGFWMAPGPGGLWAYDLPFGTYGLDSAHLCITFDADGCVIEARVDGG